MATFWEQAERERLAEVKAEAEEEEGFGWSPSHLITVLKEEVKEVEEAIKSGNEYESHFWLVAVAALVHVLDDAISEWLSGNGRWFHVYRTECALEFDIEGEGPLIIRAEQLPYTTGFTIVRETDEEHKVLETIPKSWLYMALRDYLEIELARLTGPEYKISTRIIPIHREKVSV